MKDQMELFEEGGLKDEGGETDEVSGNKVPVGGTKKGVRDDIDAMISEGEFVFPEDVTRYIGLDKLMQLRQEAKMGLKRMEAMGQMGNSDEATLPDDMPFGMEDLIIVEIGEEKEDNKKKKMQVGGLVDPRDTAQTGIVTRGATGTMAPQGGGVIRTGMQQTQPTASQQQQPAQQRTRLLTEAQTKPEPLQTKSIEDVMGEAAIVLKEYRNSAGQTLLIPFIDGKPIFPVPQGYTLYEGGEAVEDTQLPVEGVPETGGTPRDDDDRATVVTPTPKSIVWDELSDEEFLKEANGRMGFGRTLATGIATVINPIAGLAIGGLMRYEDAKVLNLAKQKLESGTLTSAQRVEYQALVEKYENNSKGLLGGVLTKVIDFVSGIMNVSEEQKTQAKKAAILGSTRPKVRPDGTVEATAAQQVQNPDNTITLDDGTEVSVSAYEDTITATTPEQFREQEAQLAQMQGAVVPPVTTTAAAEEIVMQQPVAYTGPSPEEIVMQQPVAYTGPSPEEIVMQQPVVPAKPTTTISTYDEAPVLATPTASVPEPTTPQPPTPVGASSFGEALLQQAPSLISEDIQKTDAFKLRYGTEDDQMQSLLPPVTTPTTAIPSVTTQPTPEEIVMAQPVKVAEPSYDEIPFLTQPAPTVVTDPRVAETPVGTLTPTKFDTATVQEQAKATQEAYEEAAFGAPTTKVESTLSFDDAFSAARAAGDKTFTYDGKSFTTETAEEKEKRETAKATPATSDPGYMPSGAGYTTINGKMPTPEQQKEQRIAAAEAVSAGEDPQTAVNTVVATQKDKDTTPAPSTKDKNVASTGRTEADIQADINKELASGTWTEKANELVKERDSARANEGGGSGGDSGSSDSDGTHCCTAAQKRGDMTLTEVKKLRSWHRQQSIYWQEGYDIWGKVIADHLVAKSKWQSDRVRDFYNHKIYGKLTIGSIYADVVIYPMSYVIGIYKVLSNKFNTTKTTEEA